MSIKENLIDTATVASPPRSVTHNVACCPIYSESSSEFPLVEDVVALSIILIKKTKTN